MASPTSAAAEHGGDGTQSAGTPPEKPPASPPTLELPQFRGPLDLLLAEVERQNVAIEDLAMAPIAARFLEYLATAARRNLNLDIEWLYMAATLILWKSRALLAQAPGEDPPPDPIRDDLIRQLQAHRKDAAEDLARRQALEAASFSRAAQPPPADLEFVSVWDLIQQARELAAWAQKHRPDRRQWAESFAIEPDDTTIAQMVAYLHEQLATQPVPLDGTALLASQPTPSRRSSLFLGMLEMARDRQIALQQAEIFGTIWVEPEIPE